MRLPYLSERPPNGSDDETISIYQELKDHQPPWKLNPFDLTLLHNPSIASAFTNLMGTIRFKSSLSPAAQEIAICYVAVLNEAAYEWRYHAPLALAAGVRRQALEAMLKNDIDNKEKLPAAERNVLKYTYQNTKNIVVEEALIEELKLEFTNREIVELAMTVAAYNMVSRLLVSLDIAEHNQEQLRMPLE